MLSNTNSKIQEPQFCERWQNAATYSFFHFYFVSNISTMFFLFQVKMYIFVLHMKSCINIIRSAEALIISILQLISELSVGQINIVVGSWFALNKRQLN